MFRDRRDAGLRLARKLQKYHSKADAIVLAIPRGGLVIGAEIARELRLPLDIALAKKIGHPENSELAVGAVSLNSEQVDYAMLGKAGIQPDYVKDEIRRIREDLRARYKLYRDAEKPPVLADKTVIVCDDGVATGRTLLAAVALIRQEKPAKLVCAIPVAPSDAAALLSLQADEVVCLETPQHFYAIGEFYRVFGQVSDEEAARILAESAHELT